MVIISNNGFISLNRGDSLAVPLFINMGTAAAPIRFNIVKHKKAVVYFGVMEPNQDFEDALIRQKYNYTSELTSYNDIVIRLKSMDTEYLLPGKYFYMVKLKLYDEQVLTIVPKTEFYILE